MLNKYIYHLLYYFLTYGIIQHIGYMILTRKLKLAPTPEQHKILLETMSQYKDILDYTYKIGFEHKVTNGTELHKTTYFPARSYRPKLPSNLVCTAREIVIGQLKAIKTQTKGKFDCKCPQSKKYPIISYNAHCASIGKELVGLSTISGRQKIKIVNNPFLKEDIKQLRKGCQLQYKPYRNEWYLIVFIDVKEPEQLPTKNILGIDRGVNNVAVLSNNTFINSNKTKHVIGKRRHQRRVAQSKGTRSAKRRLRSLAGKETRFRTDTNHCVSKLIVNLPYDTFVIEDLSFNRTKKLGRKFNFLLGKWSYYQLEQFLTYKSLLLGKKVVKVDARYTSQKCSSCLHTEKSNRKGNSFSCQNCGYSLNADLNASINIRNNYIDSLTISRGGRVPSTTHDVDTRVIVPVNHKSTLISR